MLPMFCVSLDYLHCLDVRWRCESGLVLVVCNDGIVFVWQLAMGHLERRVAAHALFNSESLNYPDASDNSIEGASLLSMTGKVPKSIGNFNRMRTHSLVRIETKRQNTLVLCHEHICNQFF